MRKGLIICFLLCISFPISAFSFELDDIVGFWISDELEPMQNVKSILIINNNSIQQGKRPPVTCEFTQVDGNIIATFEGPLRRSIECKINLKDDKLILHLPNAIGSYVRRTYSRISKDEVKKYLQ